MLKYTAKVDVTPTNNPQTLFQIYVPAGQKAEIHGMDLCLQGSTPASSPIKFEWLVQTSAGTSSALTAQKFDRGADETIQATMLKTFSVEPTAGAAIVSFSLHQQATWPWRPPFPIICKGGERVGIRYVSGSFVPVSLTVYVKE